jgi:uncharacterized membrane-anchored protein YhcB (DUF1043 family)
MDLLRYVWPVLIVGGIALAGSVLVAAFALRFAVRQAKKQTELMESMKRLNEAKAKEIEGRLQK